MGLDAIRGIFGEEHQLFGDAMARLFPGGIAIQRWLGTREMQQGKMTNLLNIPHMLQRTYADWDHPNAEGLIPVYKGDGSLIDYQHPGQLVMRGMGLPVQSKAQAGEFDRYLQKNRDKILGARRNILNAHLANNPSRAQKLTSEFEREFGIPFTVTRRQLQDRIRSRSVPRTERMLDRMPREVRPMYLEYAAQQAPRLGVPEGVFRGEADTSTKRRKLVQPHNFATIESESLEQLKKRMVTLEQQRQIGEGTYTPFDGY
jgi:hypothetical protein